MPFNPKRYERQTTLAAIGTAGQEKLYRARVAVVGCGGLGGIVAAYLAGAGVGYLRLIDGDTPDLTNLHRQVFFHTGHPGAKAEQLAAHLRGLNPDCEVLAVAEFLNKGNAREHIAGVDLVVDCIDRAAGKHLINDACALLGVPLVYGAVHKTEGYLALFRNQEADDVQLRDLFPAPDDRIPNCSEVGVLNTAAGLIGMLQANEVLKWLVGIGDPLVGRLLTYDALHHRQTVIRLRKTWHVPAEQTWAETPDDSALYCAAAELELTPADLATLSPQDYRLCSLLRDEADPWADRAQVLEQPTEVAAVARQLDPNRTNVLYCRSGRRSLEMVRQLRTDFPALRVWSLAGGILSEQPAS
jgi:adenylyltransferase/sulfurtransferase